VPLVNRLGSLHTPIQLRDKVLCETNKTLYCQEDISRQAENSMGRLEMCAIMVELVDFNNDQTSYEEVKSKVVQPCVSDCSLPFLPCGVRRLEDKD